MRGDCAADCRWPDGGGAWRRGIDRLAATLWILLRCARNRPSQLSELFAAGRGVPGWSDHTGARPMTCSVTIRRRIIDALKQAMRAGASFC